MVSSPRVFLALLYAPLQLLYHNDEKSQEKSIKNRSPEKQ